MKNNTVKLDELEFDTIYKDNEGRFFKIFLDEYSDFSVFDGDIVTILTWERDYLSPDENDDTPEEFAEKHGVDISHAWGLDDLINAMKEEGYYAVPVYALHHGAVSHYSIYDFHDQWDSGAVGIAFCKRQEGLLDNDDYLETIIDRRVKIYDAWVSGEIYGISRLSQDETVLDESFGYMMLDNNTTETLKEMLSAVGIDIQDEYQTATRKLSVSLE